MADLTPLAESTYCRITKIVAVRNAAPMTHMSWTFQPDEIRLTYSNGSLARPEVVASGPRILKSGAQGQRVSKHLWNADHHPDWVKVAVTTFAPVWEEVKINGAD